MPVLTVEPLASVDESSAVASGRRKPVELSLVRKPEPAPVAEASPRTSERIAMVVVPLAPVPWLPRTLNVVTVMLATLALAAEPKLLLMDEPTAGMSPEETSSMMELITALAKERTVVLVEHKMKLVMGICERLIVLHHGEFLAQGTADDIRNNDEVRRVYLGQG